MRRKKEKGIIIVIFQVLLGLLGLCFFVYGIANEIVIGFVIGGIIIWCSAIPSLVNFFKK